MLNPLAKALTDAGPDRLGQTHSIVFVEHQMGAQLRDECVQCHHSTPVPSVVREHFEHFGIDGQVDFVNRAVTIHSIQKLFDHTLKRKSHMDIRRLKQQQTWTKVRCIDSIASTFRRIFC
jgi:hypothetical protein